MIKCDATKRPLRENVVCELPPSDYRPFKKLKVSAIADTFDNNCEPVKVLLDEEKEEEEDEEENVEEEEETEEVPIQDGKRPELEPIISIEAIEPNTKVQQYLVGLAAQCGGDGSSRNGGGSKSGTISRHGSGGGSKSGTSSRHGGRHH